MACIMSNSNDATSSVAEPPDDGDRIDYEEERRILLNSVADSLTQVIRQMARVNESMNGLVSHSKEVEQVASLWRESFRRGTTRGSATTATEAADNDSTLSHSSLSLRRELS